ncbi:PREDICTED: interleukin-24 [Myotis brandtii]|uniref:interleukin-24 n=1 Tax=Myotis brandtii TaxID=109478 RepID=UPI0007041C1A|nr:PREDICTED: interleukin-24 [Myotis brandtii]
MGSPMQKTALPCLSLILLIWSQGPGAQGQEFQFGPCRVEGVVFQELWEASWAVKDIVQAQETLSSSTQASPESLFLRTESRILFLNVVLENPEMIAPTWQGRCGNSRRPCHVVGVSLGSLRTWTQRCSPRPRDPLASLGRRGRGLASAPTQHPAQLFSVLQQENEMFPIRESARRRFLLFQAAFKQLDIEAAQTKAFGEVDILLTWMQKFYQL